MKILVIDDSEFFRLLLEKYLLKEIPDTTLEHYKVEERGRPPPDFPWEEYDLLLLDYNLGEGIDGLDWLEHYRSLPGFPPTIVLTGEGDEYVAVRAIKLGAVDYFNKDDITRRRLAEIVVRTREREAETGFNIRLGDATSILERISTGKQKGSSVPEAIGYRIIRLLGKGGMSEVYLAERESDGRSQVLKILNLDNIDDYSQVKRFIQEAELVKNLDCKHVVKIFEHGFSGNVGFIAMEFFTRGDLKERLSRGITRNDALNYIRQIAKGLKEIHDAGIVHRDLKPANIMFRGDDSLALGDFGISRKIETDSSLTATHQVIGTPLYMSPEQGEGLKVDARSDIYSCGVIFFEMLTGKRPYHGPASSLIYQHLYSKIPDLPGEQRQFQGVINRMLAKDPADRFESIDMFIHVLDTET